MIVRLLQLGGWILALWFFFAVATPWLTSLSPAWQRFDDVQEKYDLNSGALYYTDVPITQDAEDAVRKAVREGMKARRDKVK